MATVDQMVEVLQTGISVLGTQLEPEDPWMGLVAFTDGEGETSIGIFGDLSDPERKYEAVDRVAEKLREDGAINCAVLRGVRTDEKDVVQILTVDLNGEVRKVEAPVSRAGFAPTLGKWKKSPVGREIRGRMIDPIVAAITEGETLEGEVVDE